MQARSAKDDERSHVCSRLDKVESKVDMQCHQSLTFSACFVPCNLCVWEVQGCGVGSSSERTRTAVTAALRKKLKDVMAEFQDLRQRLQEEYRWVCIRMS